METPASSRSIPSIPQLTMYDQDELGLIIVDIAEIQPYELNPRHIPNPEYDRIRDSIRAQGLDQPLVITQRPGASHYIVQAGGNTRLLILKTLFEETQDTRFARVPCLCKPWRRESDVLLAHLRENDLRGRLTFIDKARAVIQAKQLLSEEQGLEDLTQRQLETELRQAGYRISQGRISQMTYTVNRLLPLIPQALENGMGRPQVETIRQLDRAAAVVWREQCQQAEDEYEAVFSALCRRYDGPDWNTEVLREALDNEMAEAAEISLQTVRVMLDAALDGRQCVIPSIEPEPEIELPLNDQQELDRSTTEQRVEGVDLNDPDTNAISAEAMETKSVSEVDDEIKHDGLSVTSETPETVVLDPLVENVLQSDPNPADLKSLRGRAWTLAARLAQRHGIGELVEPQPSQGLGYVLRDVPDPALAELLDETSLCELTMLWWQLAACAEMTFAPLEAILPLLPADSILRQALETEDAELLFKSIWTLDPGHTGYRLWRLLDERDWSDLLNLMATYRHLRQSAAASGQPLWNLAHGNH